MIISSSFFIVIAVLGFAFMMDPNTNPFSELPELQQQQPAITVCGMADTLMTFQNPAKVIHDYFCHSV